MKGMVQHSAVIRSISRLPQHLCLLLPDNDPQDGMAMVGSCSSMLDYVW